MSERDSITNSIFNGDKVYYKDGNVAFKPLAMETVIESNSEHQRNKKSLASKVQLKNKIATQAYYYDQGYKKNKRLSSQTTEANLEMQ